MNKIEISIAGVGDEEMQLKVRFFFHPAGPSPSFSLPRRLDELVISRAQVLK